MLVEMDLVADKKEDLLLAWANSKHHRKLYVYQNVLLTFQTKRKNLNVDFYFNVITLQRLNATTDVVEGARRKQLMPFI